MKQRIYSASNLLIIILYNINNQITMIEIEDFEYNKLCSLGYKYPEIIMKWADVYPTYWCDEKLYHKIF